jgi:hypothetical protein
MDASKLGGTAEPLAVHADQWPPKNDLYGIHDRVPYTSIPACGNPT